MYMYIPFSEMLCTLLRPSFLTCTSFDGSWCSHSGFELRASSFLVFELEQDSNLLVSTFDNAEWYDLDTSNSWMFKYSEKKNR